MFQITRWNSLAAAALAMSPLLAHADLNMQMYAPDRVGRWYLGGGVGAFWEESNSNLNNASGQTGGFFSGGYRATPNIALEIDGLSEYQRIDRPASVTSGDGRSRLNTSGVGGVVKFILPLNRLELYAGGGVGVYNTALHVKDNPFKTEDDDTNFGYQGLLGADYFVTRNFSVGVEYRRLQVRANLDPIPGKFDAGGDLLFATFRGHF